MKIAMHAVLGDGTINLAEGPVGPETEKAIQAINEWCGGMMEPCPSRDSLEGADPSEPTQCETDKDLAEFLLWWANSAEPRSEWEVDTGVQADTDPIPLDQKPGEN